MKFLCIIFGCPNGARKWHITDCYASIAIPIDILNMGGQARYNIVRMNDLLLDCQRGGLYETVLSFPKPPAHIKTLVNTDKQDRSSG